MHGNVNNHKVIIFLPRGGCWKLREGGGDLTLSSPSSTVRLRLTEEAAVPSRPGALLAASNTSVERRRPGDSGEGRASQKTSCLISELGRLCKPPHRYANTTQKPGLQT